MLFIYFFGKKEIEEKTRMASEEETRLREENERLRAELEELREIDSPSRSLQSTLLPQTRRTTGSPPGDPFGLQEEIDAIKEKFEAVNANHNATRVSLRNARQRAEEAEEKVRVLTAQEDDCGRDLAFARLDITSLRKEVKDALDGKNEYKSELERLRQECAAKDATIQALRRQLAVRESQNKALAAASGLTELGTNRKRTAVQASGQQENEARKKTREQIGELMEAAKYGDLAKVESLANANPSLVNESLTEGGPTALSQAHKYGHKQAVLALVGAMIA